MSIRPERTIHDKLHEQFLKYDDFKYVTEPSKFLEVTSK